MIPFLALRYHLGQMYCNWTNRKRGFLEKINDLLLSFNLYPFAFILLYQNHPNHPNDLSALSLELSAFFASNL